MLSGLLFFGLTRTHSSDIISWILFQNLLTAQNIGLNYDMKISLISTFNIDVGLQQVTSYKLTDKYQYCGETYRHLFFGAHPHGITMQQTNIVIFNTVRTSKSNCCIYYR
jgi:hypothetical protein